VATSPPAYVDLHLHTTYSDGSLSPEELAEHVVRAGVRGVALTDHDTLGGVPRLRAALEAAGVDVTAGVELSATDGNADIHILAYCVDESNERFDTELKRFVMGRTERARVMLDKLRAHGADISFDTVLEIANGAAVGRPHVAEALLRAGYVKDLDEAFQRWIGARGPCYVPKTTLLVADAVRMVREVGGVALLAHPATLNHDEMIPAMIESGLDGLEVLHPRQNDAARARYHALARQHGLLISGGSDFHGTRTPTYSVGMSHVPVALLDAIRAAAGGGVRRTADIAV
jgi:predicted metal-dependent phosphoesterase TrpH